MVEIDEKQRVSLVSLKGNAVPLKKKVPYDQLQPYVNSQLHDMPKQAVPDSSSIYEDISCEDITPDAAASPATQEKDVSCEDITPDAAASPATQEKDVSCEDITPDAAASPASQEEDANVRVMLSAPNSNPDRLVTTVLQANYWLTDEHIDHAQSLLLKQYPLTRGLHSVLAFEGRNCKLHRGLKNVVQIINFGGKHWLTVSSLFMVECSKCEGWFHRSCDKVLKNVTAKTIYLCMNCK